MADSKLDPNKSYGWTGKILRVNLTDKTVSSRGGGPPTLIKSIWAAWE